MRMNEKRSRMPSMFCRISDPYHLWGLLELLEPSSGRLYEIDMLVLGYSALYLVEVKSGPGKYVGDSVDWHRIGEDGRPRWMEPPLRLANLKAKVLKSRLQHKIKDSREIPWIQPLIFLSAPEDELDIQLRADGRVGVVTRSQLRDAIIRHDYFGAPPNWRAKRINAPQVRSIAGALEAIGIKKREGQAFAGQYRLGEVLEEGPGYQDRIATHRDNEAIRGRAEFISSRNRPAWSVANSSTVRPNVKRNCCMTFENIRTS